MKSILTIIALLFALNYGNSQSTWKAPKSADALENPFKGDENALNNGKKTFTLLCVICHGTKGKGDGVAGIALNPKPKNFTLSTVQEQSDGALFWKLSNGNPPMAPYKDLITEKERWELVLYLRTFKKK